jgi:hypothetical protein
VKLQWGHILSDVETFDRGFCPVRRGRASMGPHPFGRGNFIHPGTWNDIAI